MFLPLSVSRITQRVWTNFADDCRKIPTFAQSIILALNFTRLFLSGISRASNLVYEYSILMLYKLSACLELYRGSSLRNYNHTALYKVDYFYYYKKRIRYLSIIKRPRTERIACGITLDSEAVTGWPVILWTETIGDGSSPAGVSARHSGL